MNPILKAHLEGKEELDGMFDSFTVTDHSRPLPDILSGKKTVQEKVIEDVWKLIDSQLRPKFQSFLTTYAEMILNAAKEAGPGELEEIIIPDCDNCGEPGFHKAWYGRGRATGDAWGARYYPTGSVILCQDCTKTVKEWDGEEIWKWTSDLPEHNERRINEITKQLPNNKFHNSCRSTFRQAIDEGIKEIKDN